MIFYASNFTPSNTKLLSVEKIGAIDVGKIIIVDGGVCRYISHGQSLSGTENCFLLDNFGTLKIRWNMNDLDNLFIILKRMIFECNRYRHLNSLGSVVSFGKSLCNNIKNISITSICNYGEIHQKRALKFCIDFSNFMSMIEYIKNIERINEFQIIESILDDLQLDILNRKEIDVDVFKNINLTSINIKCVYDENFFGDSWRSFVVGKLAQTKKLMKFFGSKNIISDILEVDFAVKDQVLIIKGLEVDNCIENNNIYKYKVKLIASGKDDFDINIDISNDIDITYVNKVNFRFSNSGKLFVRSKDFHMLKSINCDYTSYKDVDFIFSEQIENNDFVYILRQIANSSVLRVMCENEIIIELIGANLKLVLYSFDAFRVKTLLECRRFDKITLESHKDSINSCLVFCDYVKCNNNSRDIIYSVNSKEVFLFDSSVNSLIYKAVGKNDVSSILLHSCISNIDKLSIDIDSLNFSIKVNDTDVFIDCELSMVKFICDHLGVVEFLKNKKINFKLIHDSNSYFDINNLLPIINLKNNFHIEFRLFDQLGFENVLLSFLKFGCMNFSIKCNEWAFALDDINVLSIKSNYNVAHYLKIIEDNFIEIISYCRISKVDIDSSCILYFNEGEIGKYGISKFIEYILKLSECCEVMLGGSIIYHQNQSTDGLFCMNIENLDIGDYQLRSFIDCLSSYDFDFLFKFKGDSSLSCENGVLIAKCNYLLLDGLNCIWRRNVCIEDTSINLFNSSLCNFLIKYKGCNFKYVNRSMCLAVYSSLFSVDLSVEYNGIYMKFYNSFIDIAHDGIDLFSFDFLNLFPDDYWFRFKYNFFECKYYELDCDYIVNWNGKTIFADSNREYIYISSKPKYIVSHDFVKFGLDIPCLCLRCIVKKSEHQIINEDDFIDMKKSKSFHNSALTNDESSNSNHSPDIEDHFLKSRTRSNSSPSRFSIIDNGIHSSCEIRDFVILRKTSDVSLPQTDCNKDSSIDYTFELLSVANPKNKVNIESKSNLHNSKLETKREFKRLAVILCFSICFLFLFSKIKSKLIDYNKLDDSSIDVVEDRNDGSIIFDEMLFEEIFIDNSSNGNNLIAQDFANQNLSFELINDNSDFDIRELTVNISKSNELIDIDDEISEVQMNT